MDKNKKLVVYFNKKSSFVALIMMLAMTSLMLFLLFSFSQANIIFFPSLPFLDFLVFSAIRVVISALIALFTLGIIYYFVGILYKGPAVILDEKGIWVKHYNFIPKESIEEFYPYQISGTLGCIGIKVKDTEFLSKQSDLNGKIGIFWAKLFNSYHINLANLDTSSEDIMIFYQRYIKH